jgi:hypothetical protein
MKIALVLQQGAGLINAYNFIINSTLITPTKILLYMIHYLVNGYNGTRSTRTNHMKFSHSAAIVRFVKDKITVQPGSSVKTYFTISLPRDLIEEQGWFYSGYI